MKLYKKKILNVNVGKCLLVSLITFVIRYFYANVYLGFHNSLVTITEGVRLTLYLYHFLRFCLSLRFVILQWTYLMMQMITW